MLDLLSYTLKVQNGLSVFAWCISCTWTLTVILDQHLNSQEKAKAAAFSAAPLQGTDELVTTSSAKF